MDREVILVAVDASKEITKYALEWAVHNLARPTDSLILLAIFPSLISPLASPKNAAQNLQKSQLFSRMWFRSLFVWGKFSFLMSLIFLS